ncbi:MAG TPA: hypothetical protein VFE01_05270 [Terracidiphilus sp.]|jgi:hypothetical protein|nr:hypothetical protein [Terracidiphilus sp.]
MKTQLSFAFALVFAISSASLSIIPARGQDAPKVVLLQQYPLAPFPKPASLMSGERSCPFFLWTKAFTSEQRLGFNYVDKAGTATSNTPPLADVTIVIDPKASTPVATTDSPLELNEKVWQISMSQDTYNANANCLGGIPVKSAQ